MREIRSSGSVEGVLSNGHSYSDSWIVWCCPANRRMVVVGTLRSAPIHRASIANGVRSIGRRTFIAGNHELVILPSVKNQSSPTVADDLARHPELEVSVAQSVDDLGDDAVQRAMLGTVAIAATFGHDAAISSFDH